MIQGPGKAWSAKWPIAALLLAAACSPEPQPEQEAAPENAAAQPAATPTTPAASPAPAAPNPAANVLTPTGWGPLRIGMTLDQVTAAAGPDADPQAVGGPDPEQCDQFRPERAPEGLLVMMVDGRLARLSIVDGTLQTIHGIALGATAAAVKARLGDQARISPHEYEAPTGEYIDLWTRPVVDAYVEDPDARGIRYEVGADGTVQAIHAGGPAIQYVEGCL